MEQVRLANAGPLAVENSEQDQLGHVKKCLLVGLDTVTDCRHDFLGLCSGRLLLDSDLLDGIAVLKFIEVDVVFVAEKWRGKHRIQVGVRFADICPDLPDHAEDFAHVLGADRSVVINLTVLVRQCCPKQVVVELLAGRQPGCLFEQPHVVLNVYLL